MNVYEKILLPTAVMGDKDRDKNISKEPLSYPPINYGTSFEHKTHAVIKNIKFKLPPEYINLTNKIDLKDTTSPLVTRSSNITVEDLINKGKVEEKINNSEALNKRMRNMPSVIVNAASYP